MDLIPRANPVFNLCEMISIGTFLLVDTFLIWLVAYFTQDFICIFLANCVINCLAPAYVEEFSSIRKVDWGVLFRTFFDGYTDHWRRFLVISGGSTLISFAIWFCYFRWIGEPGLEQIIFLLPPFSEEATRGGMVTKNETPGWLLGLAYGIGVLICMH